MAQTNKTPIVLYHSTVASAVPSNANLQAGELAMNIADMKLYTENSGGTVTLLASADAAAGNFTTVDTTNLEVTNIKAKDGTSAATIADSTGIISFTANSYFANGTVSAPSISFASDTNTGLYRIGADNLGIAVNGTKILDVATTGASVVGTIGSTGNYTITNSEPTIIFSNAGNDDWIIAAGGGGNVSNGYLGFRNITDGVTPFQIAPDAIANTAILTSTGISVTGTISATKNVAFGGSALRGWGPIYSAIDLPGGSLASYSSGFCRVVQGAYDTSAGSFVYTSAGLAASFLDQNGGAFYFNTAPVSVNAGDPATFTVRATIDSTGLAVTGTLSATGKVESTLAYTNSSDLGFVVNTAIPGINMRTPSGSRFSAIVNYSGPDMIQFLGSTGAANPSVESLRVILSTGAASFANGLAITGTLSATGVATFAAGTAALPSITTTGDTNTGIYFPAADTVGITTGGAERMRIDSSGNVCIGTSSPASASTKLTVNGTNSTGVVFINGATKGIRFGFDTVGSYITGVDSTGFATFEPIAITGSSVAISASGTQIAGFTSTGLSVTGALSCSTNLAVTGTITVGSAVASAWGTNYPAIEAVGNAAGLVLASACVNPVTLYGNAYATNIAEIYKTTGEAAKYECGILGVHRFTTAPSGTAGTTIAFAEQVRITHTASAVNYWALTGSATGNTASIGVAGSDTNIQAVIQSKGTAALILGSTLGNAVRVFSPASGVNQIDLNGSATGVQPSIIATGSDTNIGLLLSTKGTGSLALQTNNTGATQVLISHTASANRYITLTGSNGGNPTISTSAGALALGNGQLQFPATQNPSSDANTLDDYEEGTWTPSLQFDGAAVGMTYTTRTGKYTKIGNLVTISCVITLSAKGSSTGVARITSLPFASSSVQTLPPPFVTGLVTATSVGMAVTASPDIDLYNSQWNYSAALTDANLSNTSQILFTVSYLV